MLRLVSALTTLLMSTVVAQTTFTNDTLNATNFTDGPIILDATYLYVPGVNQSDVIKEINTWFNLYESKQEFSNGVKTFMFAHIKNGVRSVIVFENTLAYLMHRNNTYESALSSQALASGLKF
jgi:hypothetical protein